MKLWTKALGIAEQTPPERNRYVDLLRALSITAVVLGHWIMAAPSFQADGAQMQHLLDIQPWSRWLTWIFQVMPVFFFVGGFSNGVSWDNSQKSSLHTKNSPSKQVSYGQWLDARLRRLLGPAVPLVILWTVLAVIGHQTQVPTEFTRIGSQVSLVPVWFLAIYFIIVMLVPVSRWAWNRFGFASVFVPALLAVLGDLAFFNTPYRWFGWFNYLFIWGAVHQLGYAWQQGKLPSAGKSLAISVAGLVTLLCLTKFGPYPLSLVGVPSQDISNTTPPKLPLLALAATQIGLLLALEKPARSWLSGVRPWAATVLVNGLIMPIFLWHSTIMMLLIGAAFWLMPMLLTALPGTGEWWAYRPVWVLIYSAVMLMLLPLFLWSEKLVSAGQRKPRLNVITIVGALCISVGLAMLAAKGVTGDGLLGVNWLACMLPPIGLLVVTLGSKRAA